MIMIHCHLHKLVEFVKNRLIHSSNDSSTQEIITRAVQVFYDQSVSELIVNNGYLYYAKYSRRFTILDHTVPLIIKRVYRKGSSADAVLLSFMIPYSSRTADDFTAVLTSCGDRSFTVEESGNSFDYDAVRLIRWKFNRYWQSILNTRRIYLKTDITTNCITLLGRQFLQNRKLRCQLVFT